MATPARPDKPQTTHTTPALLHGDSELPAPRAFPTKIEPLGAILWFIGLVRRHAFRLATYIYAILMGVARRHTFRSAILLYLVLAGVTAGATRWSFHWQAQSALYQIPYGKDGVSPSSTVSPAQSVPEMTRHTVGCDCRTQLWNRFGRPNTVGPMGGRGLWEICVADIPTCRWRVGRRRVRYL